MAIIDLAGSGALDLYVRIAALAIGPVIGIVVFAVAMIGAPR